jgi:ATP-dependent Clp protease adaptor protein ClpS
MAEQLQEERVQSVEAVKPPSMYHVIMLNDDFTPMEFVISVLKTVFFLDEAQATQVMMDVHQHGGAICGVFTRDVARSKVRRVLVMAQESQYPLQCTVEPAGHHGMSEGGSL